MSLIFDDRVNVGTGAGLHALIIGISHYSYLSDTEEPSKVPGMTQLTSAAYTAFCLSHWLVDRRDNLPVPLATCRLLVAPSSVERQKEQALATIPNNEPCSLENIVMALADWRLDASSNPKNHTLLYFAGHGIARFGNDCVLLLEDFGESQWPMLRNAIDVQNIYKGMAPGRYSHNIARTQLYFFDTCRQPMPESSRFENLSTTSVFDIERSVIDNRSAPILFASDSGGYAYGLADGQTLFGKALLECLNGAGGQTDIEDINGNPLWRVTLSSLCLSLKKRLAELNAMYHTNQTFMLGGMIKDPEEILHVLDGPPSAKVVFVIEPPDARRFVGLRFCDASQNQIFREDAPVNPHPYVTTVPAGTYRLTTMLTHKSRINKYRRHVKWHFVLPPTLIWQVEV